MLNANETTVAPLVPGFTVDLLTIHSIRGDDAVLYRLVNEEALVGVGPDHLTIKMDKPLHPVMVSCLTKG